MSSLLVFPGQGAPRPGMLARLPDDPVVTECLSQAQNVLGQPLHELDSAEALTSTRNVQLSLLIAGTACARLLLANAPAPSFVAGLSIGAYAAAVACGALDFADALRLVAIRGESMQRAYPGGYGMTAIIGLAPEQVEALVTADGGEVYLANINADNQVVVAGSDAAMIRIAEQARAQGAASARRLAMSVPSHCRLLEGAAAPLVAAFAKVELARPKIRYLSSTSARPILDLARLRDDLALNLCRVVDWRAMAQSAVERGVRLQIECAPGAVLTGLARRLMPGATAVALDGARLDTLYALLREEDARP